MNRDVGQSVVVLLLLGVLAVAVVVLDAATRDRQGNEARAGAYREEVERARRAVDDDRNWGPVIPPGAPYCLERVGHVIVAGPCDGGAR